MVSTASRALLRGSTIAVVALLLVVCSCTRESNPPVEDTVATIETAKELQESHRTVLTSDWQDEVKNLQAANDKWPTDKLAQRAMVKALDDHDGSNKDVLTVSEL